MHRGVSVCVCVCPRLLRRMGSVDGVVRSKYRGQWSDEAEISQTCRWSILVRRFADELTYIVNKTTTSGGKTSEFKATSTSIFFRGRYVL